MFYLPMDLVGLPVHSGRQLQDILWRRRPLAGHAFLASFGEAALQPQNRLQKNMTMSSGAPATVGQEEKYYM